MAEEQIKAEIGEKPENNQNRAKRLGRYAMAGGPGRPKGSKNHSTIISEAKLQIAADLLGLEPSKRFYKRWIKNYAKRHPKEALQFAADIVSKFESKDKGDTHLHLNLAELVDRTWKKKPSEDVAP